MSRGPAPGAELRVVRLLTAGVAVASVLLLALQPNSTWRPVETAEWMRAGLLLSLLIPVLVGACAPWLRIAALRRGNATTAMVALALIPAVVLHNLLAAPEDRHLPWLLTAYGPSAVAALIAWGPRVAWWLLGATVLGTQAIRLWSETIFAGAGINDIQGLLTAVALLALSGLLLITTRDTDRQALAARAYEARASAEAARVDARDQAAALVHDEVLAALLLAARAQDPAMRAVVERQAARAVRLIRELDVPADRSPVPTDRLITRLRAVATREAPAARFEVRASNRATVPPDVAAAVAGSLRQALANSVAHAGPGARSTVRGTIGGDGVRVRIHDDGVGFDPTTPAGSRMGIAVSIVGRMRALPGGGARVDSRPGRGTTVSLCWVPRTLPAMSTPADRQQWLQPLLTGWSVRNRGRLLLGIFVAGQVGMAALAAAATPEGPRHAIPAMAGILVATGLVWGRSRERPSPRRSLAAVAVLVGTASLSWIAVAADRIEYGDLWYLTSAALVLVMLAVKGWPGLAVAGGTLVATVVAGGIVVTQIDATEATSAIARALVNVVLGTLLVAGIRRATTTTARLEALELQRVRVRSWEQARRTELARRSHELDALIGRTLERIASGAALDDADRRECLALEGRLRDHYRGGQLARSPLTEAAMAARVRGVDVRLLDDAGRRLAEPQLERIVEWMCDQLDCVPGGTFTGRILPAGRDGVASVVAGEEATVLGHSCAGRRGSVPSADR